MTKVQIPVYVFIILTMISVGTTKEGTSERTILFLNLSNVNIT